MSTFLGMKASQNWHDFPIWEEFFNTFPIKSFIELGTDEGGMSVFLALQCMQREIHFRTIDHQKWMDFGRHVPRLLKLESCYRCFDLFSESGISEMETFISTLPKPLAIFFDDGDKPREWKTFAPMTSPGDFCIVHDWGVEFKESDLLDVKVERILTKLSDERGHGWKSMWFRRLA